MNERELIRRIVSRLGTPPREILHGIGDDTALLRLDPEKELLVTTDSQREGVHFRWDWMTPEEVGYRLVIVNASDIFAKGGNPLSAFVTLALPSGTTDLVLEGLYDGIFLGCQSVGAYLSGGDISRTTGGLDLTMTLLGVVPVGGFVSRGGLSPGDRIYSIGRPGVARSGFLALSGGILSNELLPAISAFKRPRSFPSFPSWLRRHPWISAAMDSSDGLGQALGSLALSSGVSIMLTDDPDLAYLSEIGRALSIDPKTLAMEGGEDYDLIVGVPSERSKEFEKEIGELFHETYDQMTYWGEVGERGVPGTIVLKGGIDPEDWGFDHVRG